MINTRCAICNLNNYSVKYKVNFSLSNLNANIFSARRIPDNIHYQIVKCKKCSLVYSNPIVNPQKLQKLYKHSRYTYGEYEQELTKTYKKYLKQYIRKVPKNSSFLEIGCGNGFFLKEALNLGFKKVFGVEPGIETVKQADRSIKSSIIVDIFKPGQFKKESVDVICLFQVLDHIPNPNSFLAECYKILKREGKILCINHNVDSWSAKILSEKSPIYDIEHTYLFNKDTLGLVFEKNKFNNLKVFNVWNYYPLSYWLKMVPIPRKIKNILAELLITTKFDFKFWISAGNIGIIANK